MMFMNRNGVYAALVLFSLGTATLMAQSADSEHVSQLLATAKNPGDQCIAGC